MSILNDLPSDTKILVSVSGGSDSIYLTWLLSQQFAKNQLVCIYFNHDLRSKTAISSDKTVIKKLIKQLNLNPLICDDLPVKKAAQENKQSLETTARQLRRNQLYKYAIQYQCSYIALGHHLDDHIETALFQLIRGTLSQFNGIQAITQLKSLQIIRPLLHLTKSEIKTEIKKHQLDYNEDETNKSIIFTRNKIRQQLIPIINEINPTYRNKIDQFITYHQDVQQLIQEQLKKPLTTITITKNKMYLPQLTFESIINPLLQKNWIRYAIKNFIATLKINPLIQLNQLDAIHINAIATLFSKNKGKEMSLPMPFLAKKHDYGIYLSVKLS